MRSAEGITYNPNQVTTRRKVVASALGVAMLFGGAAAALRAGASEPTDPNCKIDVCAPPGSGTTIQNPGKGTTPETTVPPTTPPTTPETTVPPTAPPTTPETTVPPTVPPETVPPTAPKTPTTPAHPVVSQPPAAG